MSKHCKKNRIALNTTSIETSAGKGKTAFSVEKTPIASRSKRECLIGLAAGALGLVLGTQAIGQAAEAGSTKSVEKQDLQEYIDRLAVEDLILRERRARDNSWFPEMASYYHPDSIVDVSWFHGSGADFVVGTQKMAARNAGNTYGYHAMGPSIVTIRKDRALLDSDCLVHAITDHEGCKVDLLANIHILWRVQRDNKQWLIAGLHAYYINTALLPGNPEKVPNIDQNLLNKFRSSYCLISYFLSLRGRPVRDDLPGVDKPETVAALYKADQEWLAKG
jgi:hypothetical protein